MDNNKHIDEVFRDKLSGHQYEFVPEHWEMMKSVLDAAAKSGNKGFIGGLSKILIMVSALVMVVSGVYVYCVLNQIQSSSSQKQTSGIYSSTFVSDHTSRIISESISDNQQFTNPVTTNHYIAQSPVNNQQYQQQQFTTAEITEQKDKNDKNNPQNNIQIINNEQVENADNQSSNNNVVVVETDEQQTYSNNQINAGVIRSRNDGYKESEAQDVREKIVINSVEQDDITGSIVDDYLAKKEKADAKNRKQKKNQKTGRSTEKFDHEAQAQTISNLSALNELTINPAFTGINRMHNVSISAMAHKPLYKPASDFSIPFEYSIAYDFSFGKYKNYGLGVNYRRFVGAAEGSLGADLTFAYRFDLNRNSSLRVGATACYLAYDINQSSLNFGDMLDGRHGFVYNTHETFPEKSLKSRFDLNVGFWYNWKTLYIGLAGRHLTSPDIGMLTSSGLSREYSLSAAYGLKIGRSFEMLPSVEMRYNENLFYCSPSLLFSYRRWLLYGVSFQDLNTAGIILGFNFYNNFIVNIRGGIPLNKGIRNNFGIIDYAGADLRIQFGKTK